MSYKGVRHSPEKMVRAYMLGGRQFAKPRRLSIEVEVERQTVFPALVRGWKRAPAVGTTVAFMAEACVKGSKQRKPFTRCAFSYGKTPTAAIKKSLRDLTRKIK